MPRGALVLVLLAVGLLTTLTLAFAIVPSSPSSPGTTSGLRQFYLSKTYVSGSGAITACAEGYHFASIWEIAGLSNLKYNIDLGRVSSDSGQGPPTAVMFLGNPIPARGWVRTGYSSSATSPFGQANCSVWSSNSGFQAGTVASLPSDWTGGGQDIGVWETETRSCNMLTGVWCIQDDVSWYVYLPVVQN
jgi:hypothetical protein